MNTQADAFISEKTQWTDVIVLWLVGIFAAMQFAKFSIAYDSLLHHYNVDAAAVGLLLSTVGMIGLIFGVVAGVVSSKLEYKNVLIGAVVIGGCASLLQASQPNYYVLFASRVVEGLSHLGIVVAAPTLMLRASEKRHHALVMGLWGTFFGVAFAVAGWAGSQILQSHGFAALCLSHGALALPLLVYCWVMISNIATDNTTGSVRLTQLMKSTLRVYVNPRTCLPGIVFLFHTTMFIALLTFIPRLSTDEQTKTLLMVLLPLSSIIGTFLAGFLSQYVLKPPLLLFLAYAGVFIFALITVSLQGSHYLFASAALSLMLISGIVQGGSFTLIPYLSRSESEQAMGNGSIAQMGNVGATIGTPLFAYALDLYSGLGLLFIVAALCTAGCIIAIVSRKDY